VHQRAAIRAHAILVKIKPVLAVQQILDLDQSHNVITVRTYLSGASLQDAGRDQADRHDEE